MGVDTGEIRGSANLKRLNFFCSFNHLIFSFCDIIYKETDVVSLEEERMSYGGLAANFAVSYLDPMQQALHQKINTRT